MDHTNSSTSRYRPLSYKRSVSIENNNNTYVKEIATGNTDRHDSRMQQLHATIQRYIDRCAVLEREVGTKDDIISDLRSRLEGKVSRLERVEEEFEKYKKDSMGRVGTIESEMKACIKEYDADMKHMSEKARNMNSKLFIQQSINSQLMNDNLMKQKEIEDLNKFIYQLEEELKNTESSIKSFENDLYKKIKDMSDTSSMVHIDEYNRVVRDRDDAIGKYNDLLDDVRSYDAIIQDRDTLISTLKNTVQSIRMDNNRKMNK